MNHPNLAIILCSVPDTETGRKIATALLDKKLAACITILPETESHYEWEGKRESTRETLLLIKTFLEKFLTISDAIRDIHPYECPEIILLESVATFEKYATWAKKCIL